MMMRRIGWLCLVWIVSLPLFSQQLRREYERELSVGCSGGIGLSRVSFLHNNAYRMNELGNQGFTTGYRMGVVTRFLSQRHFGIQLELNYVRSGWSELFYDDSGITKVNDYDMQNVRLTRRLHYLEIPFLAHIYFGERRVRFFVELGPEVSVMMKYGDLTWNIPESDERRKAIPLDDPRLGDDYGRLDYGLAGGIGFDIQTGNVHTIIGGRFTYAFKDLYGNNKSDVFQRSNNQLINITATILVPVLKYKEKKR
ncbi:MAG: porin family protein [Bacteroidales bacterium]|nr:porin family protein [Bacteroidales bacterium]